MPEPDRYEALDIGPGAHVPVRLYDAPDARAGVVLVGGIGGGFDSPARELYVRLGRHLSAQGVAVLRVRFRLPGELGEAVMDVGAGVRFLAERGCGRVALVGYSFGGAVVIRAGAALPEVAAVVALSTQSHGTERVTRLVGRPLLLVHGVDDEVLAPSCSVDVYRRAGEPKELRLLPRTRHGLDEAADEVYQVTHDFLVQHLGVETGTGARPGA